jgi:hypothetical protein
VNEVKTGTGIATRKNEKTFQLIDDSAQLEYFYEEKVDIICGMELHKLTNLDTAYLQIKHVTSAAIYNLATRFCLTIDLYPVACDEHKAAQNRRPYEFVFVGAQIAILTNNKTECVAHQPTPEGFAFRRVTCGSRNNFHWDSASLRIIGIKEPNPATGAASKIGCLALQFNAPDIIFFQDCNESELQKWVLGPPSTAALKRHSGKSPLLIQHHQFMEHQAVVNENILASEIQSIYCGNLQMRKHLTMLLAESNGLAAARANNLPQCQRLKVLGGYFIIQQCAPINITVGMKMTRCGHEPIYKNFTIGKDGFSLHPFQSCFWKDDTISLQGKAYRWIGEKWTEIFPTVHLATLHLAQRFSDIVDDEAQYISPASNPFERAEYEQTNSVNEIINAIHETNSNSLSAIIINEHEESRWWSVYSWTNKLQSALVATCCVVGGGIVILLLLWKYKTQLSSLRAILEHFAVNRQTTRRNRTPALTN